MNKEVTLNLAQVHCPDCARDLKDMILGIKGVSTCEFDRDKLALAVGYGDPADEREIRQAIMKAGYDFREEEEEIEPVGGAGNKLIIAAIVVLVLVFILWSRGF